MNSKNPVAQAYILVCFVGIGRGVGGEGLGCMLIQLTLDTE